MWPLTRDEVAERRSAPRVPFFGRVTLEAGSGERFDGWGANLSEGGMLVHSRGAHPLQHGDVVRVRFQLPQAAGEVVSVARIAHRQHEALVGLRFTALRPERRRMLSTYVFTGSGRVRDYHA